MKCISLWQPWAALLCAGQKRVETRGWATPHRGPLLVHAAAKKVAGHLPGDCPADYRQAMLRFIDPAEYEEAAADKDPGHVLSFGAVIGRVEVVGCLPTSAVMVLASGRGSKSMLPTVEGGKLYINAVEEGFGNYDHGRYAWVCANAVLFDRPVPYRGSQGIFEVPDDLIPEQYRS